MHHDVTSSDTEELSGLGDLEDRLKEKYDRLLPMQPRDEKGRAVSRYVAYPNFTNLWAHGSGHTLADTNMLEVLQLGIAPDRWPHVYTGNCTKKTSQHHGVSVMGPPAGLGVRLAPVPLSVIKTGASRTEPLCCSWILQPLIDFPGNKATLEESVENAMAAHEKIMVKPLLEEYLERIRIIGSPEELKLRFELEEQCYSTVDYVLNGSKETLAKLEITERAKDYYKTMIDVYNNLWI